MRDGRKKKSEKIYYFILQITVDFLYHLITRRSLGTNVRLTAVAIGKRRVRHANSIGKAPPEGWRKSRRRVEFALGTRPPRRNIKCQWEFYMCVYKIFLSPSLPLSPPFPFLPSPRTWRDGESGWATRQSEGVKCSLAGPPVRVCLFYVHNVDRIFFIFRTHRSRTYLYLCLTNLPSRIRLATTLYITYIVKKSVTDTLKCQHF